MILILHTCMIYSFKDEYVLEGVLEDLILSPEKIIYIYGHILYIIIYNCM